MARPQAVTVSKDKSGRTIYCVGSKYFYTRAKAEAHAGVSSSAKEKKAAKSRKTAAKTRGTSTASDAYHWLHAGRRSNPKRNPNTGRFVRRNRNPAGLVWRQTGTAIAFSGKQRLRVGSRWAAQDGWLIERVPLAHDPRDYMFHLSHRGDECGRWPSLVRAKEEAASL